MNWLKEEVTGFWRVLFFVLGCIGIDLIWCLVFLGVFCLIGISLSENTVNIPIFSFLFLPKLLLFAFIEEGLFRFPLVVFVKIKNDYAIVFSVLVSSVLFGLCHGGYNNIFIQGFSGLVFSVVFLKSGAFQGKMFKPLVVSTLAHFVSNLIIVGIIVMKGGTSI